MKGENQICKTKNSLSKVFTLFLFFKPFTML